VIMTGVGTDRATGRRVVAGVDPLRPSRRALRWAASIACALDAAIDAIAVWDITAVMAADWVNGWDPEQETAARLSAVVAEVLGTRPPVPVRQAVRRGRPADQLVQASQGAQMLILGRQHRGGLRRLLQGSVSDRCAALARCPVLIAAEGTAPPSTAPPSTALPGGLTPLRPARHLVVVRPGQ
jgi:nucleotide-binding universal stress UspA family protein